MRMFLGRYGVVSAGKEYVASHQPEDGEKKAFDGSVSLNCFNGVL